MSFFLIVNGVRRELDELHIALATESSLADQFVGFHEGEQVPVDFSDGDEVSIMDGSRVNDPVRRIHDALHELQEALRVIPRTAEEERIGVYSVLGQYSWRAGDMMRSFTNNVLPLVKDRKPSSESVAP